MKVRISPIFAAMALLAIIGMALGCAQKTDDTKITSTIQSSFNADSGLQRKQLGVQSENGVVTLSGAVDTDAQRTAASKYAAAAPGVKEVVNNLQVGAGPAPAESAQAQASPAPQSASASAPADRPSPSHRRKHAASSDDSSNQNQSDSAGQMAQAGNSIPAAAPEPATPAPPAPPLPPPPPQKVTIPSGTTLSVRL